MPGEGGAGAENEGGGGSLEVVAALAAPSKHWTFRTHPYEHPVVHALA